MVARLNGSAVGALAVVGALALAVALPATASANAWCAGTEGPAGRFAARFSMQAEAAARVATQALGVPSACVRDVRWDETEQGDDLVSATWILDADGAQLAGVVTQRRDAASEAATPVRARPGAPRAQANAVLAFRSWSASLRALGDVDVWPLRDEDTAAGVGGRLAVHRRADGRTDLCVAPAGRARACTIVPGRWTSAGGGPFTELAWAENGYRATARVYIDGRLHLVHVRAGGAVVGGVQRARATDDSESSPGSAPWVAMNVRFGASSAVTLAAPDATTAALSAMLGANFGFAQELRIDGARAFALTQRLPSVARGEDEDAGSADRWWLGVVTDDAPLAIVALETYGAVPSIHHVRSMRSESAGAVARAFVVTSEWRSFSDDARYSERLWLLGADGVFLPSVGAGSGGDRYGSGEGMVTLHALRGVCLSLAERQQVEWQGLAPARVRTLGPVGLDRRLDGQRWMGGCE